MAGPANNYYIGLKRGDSFDPENCVTNAAVSAGPANGTASDVEVRIQTNDGSNATGITKKDVVTRLLQIIQFIENNGSAHAGANLPGG